MSCWFVLSFPFDHFSSSKRANWIPLYPPKTRTSCGVFTSQSWLSDRHSTSAYFGPSWVIVNYVAIPVIPLSWLYPSLTFCFVTSRVPSLFGRWWRENGRLERILKSSASFSKLPRIFPLSCPRFVSELLLATVTELSFKPHQLKWMPFR